MPPEVSFVPPEVLMGEAGICSFWAMVAVAYVYQRNPRMTGHQEPNDRAKLAAGLWPFLPDVSLGARYVFSLEDMRRERVRRIVGGRPPKIVYPCKVGALVFY